MGRIHLGVHLSHPQNRFVLARVMYAGNLVFAGVPGLVITVFPYFARTEMFQGSPEPMTLGMLGAIWLAIGLVSIAGLREPERFLGVFAVQAVYKTIWVATGATALWNAHPEAWIYGIGFGIAALGFVGALAQAWRSDAAAPATA